MYKTSELDVRSVIGDTELVFLRGYLFCYSITSKIVHKFYLLIQSQDLLKAENETRVVHREDCLGEEWFR